jgi:hypothetical protein
MQEGAGRGWGVEGWVSKRESIKDNKRGRESKKKTLTMSVFLVAVQTKSGSAL